MCLIKPSLTNFKEEPMEHEKWITSDTHLFHENMLKFKDYNGMRIRPFSSLKEMHQTIIKNWNSVVGVNDYVYHLGDVTFKIGREFNELMHSLNGKKRLIVGNHDGRFLKEVGFTKHFEKIELWHGYHDKDDGKCSFTMSHIPILLSQLRDGDFNVHGHMHQNEMKDPHYLNKCVELTNFTPVHFDTIFEEIRAVRKDLENIDKINRNLNK